jgi:Cdc6-like AAA superfamily ATPase
MVAGRPLFDNEADAALFVLPDAWGPLVRAIDHQLNVLVVGPRGIGKTTLLRQMQKTLRERGERVAYVDATALDDAPQLAARLRATLASRRPASGFARTGLGLGPSDLVVDPAQQLYDDLQALAKAPQTVVLVDASGSGRSVYGVFGRMRDTIWQTQHQWVVAVDLRDRTEATKPPADAFFDVTVTIDPFETDDLAKLLEKREPDLKPRQRKRIASAADGNPRVALRAVNDLLVHGLDPNQLSASRAEAIDRASELGDPHARMMSELIDLARASPSDDVLLNRVGVSRARATAILRDLLEQGLVRAISERSDGPGRPKTVYYPNYGE